MAFKISSVVSFPFMFSLPPNFAYSVITCILLSLIRHIFFKSYKNSVNYVSSCLKIINLLVMQDKAIISYTNTKKRVKFNRMIEDCLAGKIDMVITKSISRFARNTLDTLQYVRQLKEKGIAVFFEKESVNTLVPKANY